MDTDQKPEIKWDTFEMPPKNSTKRPQHVIDEAVQRFMRGDASAVQLAREYKVSKPGFYLWVNKYKAELLEKSKREGMSQHDAETANKRDLIVELQSLKAENAKLRNKVVALMIKTGEL